MRLFTWGVVSLALAGCGDDADEPPPADPGAIRQETLQLGELTFDARVAGPAEGELVLLLHGFPETSYEWRAQLRALGEAGYHAVAPDQRGYSPGARPGDDAQYELPLLVSDAVGMADSLGAERFHLVGHDWGAGVAWTTAALAPERLLSLTTVSVPHLDAFNEQLSDEASCQSEASSYFDYFVMPGFANVLLGSDAALLRDGYEGIEEAAIEEYLRVLGTPEALDAALAWYRANLAESFGGAMLGPIEVPTTFIWGDADAAVCREGAEATADFVSGPYRFEALPGANHWVPEVAAAEVTRILLEHLAANAGG
jgi:pimeloyl-ACP methyl ester carboxylesterase